MSDSKKKYPQKTYCYMSDCKPVRAGFHLENYASCSKCKLELSEKLYNDLKSKDKSLKARAGEMKP